MPLRDHFRPPVSLVSTWDALHGGLPMIIVQHLRKKLPPGFVAAPSVHLGSQIEVDVATYERDDSPRILGGGNGGLATLPYVPESPALSVEIEDPGEDEYEVRVYDVERGRQLVATIEIVSPGNKDRPDKRRAFIGKCAGLIRQGVAVTIVDLVTVRPGNLFLDLMEFMGNDYPAWRADPPPLYAVSCRMTPLVRNMKLSAWPRVMQLGQALPVLPLWLTETLSVRLDLEDCYERACEDLWITG